jgi:NADH-quinone oxidoreductase subunit C
MLDEKVVSSLKDRFKDKIVDVIESCGDSIATVELDSLHDVLSFLYKELGFDYLLFITALDYPKREGKRFDVVYQLRSTSTFDEIRIKAAVDEDEEVDSVTDIWVSAIGDECETYDMFGIWFKNHQGPGGEGLRRAFMPDDWNGYPLRKEYPLKGDEFSDQWVEKLLPEGQRHKPEHTKMP